MSVNGVIDALAQEGLLTILAEPNLTAMSGETANFLAGGEFPIPVPQSNGSISIQFQSYGISLAFTPTVLSGDRISLHVRPEVSELTDVGAVVSSNITVPALTTRKAETTVEVASGESFAIAGLMNNNQSQTVNKFPMLGDLPILGALFRSDHFVNGQTELVVIITPYIVKPSKNRLSLPTDGYSPPSERERYTGLRYSSGDKDARPVSGEPVAVRAVPPAPAPLAPVSSAPAQEKEVKAAPVSQTETKGAPLSSSNLSLKQPVEQKQAVTPALPPKPQVQQKAAAPAPKPTASSVKPVAKAPVPQKKTETVPLSTSNLTLRSPVEQKAAAPAPAAAPATPVTKAPVKKVKEETVSSQSSSVLVPVEAPKSSSSSKKSKAPLVFHTSGDANKQSGGLLVE
jgi:hypothetical protein